MEESSTVRLNILFGSGREREKGLQQGVQDFKEDGVVTCCGEPVLSPLVRCGDSATWERAGECSRTCLLPEGSRTGLYLPTEGSQPPRQWEDGLARHPGLSALLSVRAV